MMSCTWRESLKSLFKNQIAPEKYEELEKNKADFESKVTKILKLINEGGAPLRNSIKGSELITLIKNFHEKYQSLYTLYGQLSEELREEVQKLIEIPEEELEAATNDEGEEVLSSEYLTALHKIQAAWKTIGDLENKAENLVDERLTLEVEYENLMQQLEFANQQITDLEGQFFTLKNRIASKEGELTEIGNSLEEVNDALSQLELVVQQSKIKIVQLVVERSMLVTEKGTLKQQLEFVSQQVSDLNRALEAMQENENKIVQERDELEGQTLILMTNRIAFKERELMEIKDSMETMNIVLSQLELVVQQFMEDHEMFQNCTLEISEKLRSTEKLVSLAKNEKQMLLREKSVSELVDQSVQLGKGIKTKDEKKVGFEEQRETIRQLCLSVDYHRERCDRLNKMLISKTKDRN